MRPLFNAIAQALAMLGATKVPRLEGPRPPMPGVPVLKVGRPMKLRRGKRDGRHERALRRRRRAAAIARAARTRNRMGRNHRVVVR